MKYCTLSRLFNSIPVLCIVLFLITGCNNQHRKTEGISKSAEDSLKSIQQTAKSSETENRKLDSLGVLLKKAKEDTSRLRIMNEIIKTLTVDSIKFQYCQQMLDITEKYLAGDITPALKKRYLLYQGKAFYRMGAIEFYAYHLTKAEEYTNKSIDVFKEAEDKEGLADAFNLLGNIAKLQYNYEKALELFNKSVQLGEETGKIEFVVKPLNNIGLIYIDQGKYDKALEYSEKSLEQAKQLGDSVGVSTTLNNIGNIYSLKGELTKAMEYYNESLRISEKFNDIAGISRASGGLAINFTKMGDIAMALKYFEIDLKASYKMNNAYSILNTMNNIGIIYENQKDYDKAFEYYDRGLKLAEEVEDKSSICMGVHNCANVFYAKGEPSKAIEYYIKSIKLGEEINDWPTVESSYNNLAVIYEHDAREIVDTDRRKSDSLTELALEYFNKSLKINEEIGDEYNAAVPLTSIGRIYLRKNKLDKALEYTNRAYKLSHKTGAVLFIGDAAKLLQEIYTAQGNYKLAFKYLGEYIVMKDSTDKTENQRLIQSKYYQYAYQKKAATDSIEHSNEMKIATLEIEKQKSESRRQKLIIGFVVVGLLLVLLIAGVILRSLRLTRKQKQIIETQKKEVDTINLQLHEQNEEIISQRDEIEAQRDEIMAQRDTVMEQKQYIENMHSELTGSIRYAERIQKAALPSDTYIQSVIADCGLKYKNLFILYKPRDVVSGDFYLFERKNNILYIAVADCTGHGVPGALMSMLGISFLSEILAREKAPAPDLILNELRRNIIHSLEQKGIEGEQKDGLDIALVAYHIKSKKIQFAGSNNPLYLVRNGSKDLNVIEPDTMPVAIYDIMDPFTNHELKLQTGDTIYLSSDGFGDQFGGPKGKKFMIKKLKQLLAEVSAEEMPRQREILEQTLEDWKFCDGIVYPQTDDITVMGFRVE